MEGWKCVAVSRTKSARKVRSFEIQERFLQFWSRNSALDFRRMMYSYFWYLWLSDSRYYFKALRVSMTSITGCRLHFLHSAEAPHASLPFCSRGSKCFEPKAAHPSSVGNSCRTSVCTWKSKLSLAQNERSGRCKPGNIDRYIIKLRKKYCKHK